MFNPTEVMTANCIKQLESGYRRTYGSFRSDYADVLGWVARMALETIAHSDAPYHDIEHTILVTLVGQEILRGKQLQEGSVSPEDWLHFIVALLCHDIGYIKGICQADRIAERVYATGLGDEVVQLPVGSTDASLTPYHVDRGQRFVEENFAAQPAIAIEIVNHHIELTRFPVPNAAIYQETASYAGLARAADLLGQLSDPRYLQKIPSLFYEFAETGANRALGYRHPDDLRAGYPAFFKKVVCPYIQPALHHLKATQQGRDITAHLYANVLEVEEELLGEAIAA
jgi:hypothetical protein